MEAGREFKFLEIIGTNVLANRVVRHFSNLTAKECWESAKRVLRVKRALGGIIDFNSSEHPCRDSIYSKGKVQRHFFGEPANRGGRWGQNCQLIWWLVSELYLGWRGNIWRLLSTNESRIRDRGGFGLCRGWEDARAWKIAWTWIRYKFEINKLKKLKHFFFLNCNIPHPVYWF